MRTPLPKARIFWPVLLTLLLIDSAAKRFAIERLSPAFVPHDVIGSIVRFRLTYNQGAAMSLSLGGASRWGFSVLAIAVLAFLGRMYRDTHPDDTPMALILACICGGAAGNLLDRLTSARGVVDFIDIGIGAYRFYTFNVADIGVTLGVIALLALSWRRESEQRTVVGR